jgi:hypothetical protein
VVALIPERGGDSALSRLADRLDPTPSPYLRDPVKWNWDKTGRHMTRDQARIAQSVVENRYTAVKSCHDVGKSYTAGSIGPWWIDIHEPGEAFVITTAPTSEQVGAILWREINRTHVLAQLDGYITGDNKWKLPYLVRREHDDRGRFKKTTEKKRQELAELVALGRKPADYNPAAFTGIHARYPLIIIDEACGVPKALYEAVDSLATNANARVLAIGNPDDPSSYFEEVCRPGSGWNVIRIDGLRSPGMTRTRIRPFPRLRELMAKEGIRPSDEDIPDDLYDLLIDPQWIEERIRRWGVDSPVFSSKVRGEFPRMSVDSLIHPHWVTLAQARETPDSPYLREMGVDVARYGSNRSIICMRSAARLRIIKDIPYGPLTELSGWVIRIGNELAPIENPLAVVDESGLGGGVVDILREEKYPVQGFIGNATSKDLLKNGKPRFDNLRSELLWRVREAFAGRSGTGVDGWPDLDPSDDETAAQLVNIKYSVNRHGQIHVESKDEMAARGVDSPDRLDALALSMVPDVTTRAPTVNEGAMIMDGILTQRW